MKRTMILSAVTALCLLNAAGQAQVVISQVYGGGGNSGAPVKNDFVELKNIGTTTIDIAGWTIQRTGNTANFTAGQVSAPISGLTSLAPGQYFLIECAAGANTAAPALPTPDFQALALTLGANDGKVALVAGTTLLSITNPADFDQTTFNPVNPLIKDFVGYGTAANRFEGTGPTLNTSNTLSVSRGNNGCDETNNNNNDFSVLGGPNPRNRASIVPCGVAFPDVALQLSNSGCNPTTLSTYDVTAQVSNLQGLAAAGTTVTLVLPPALTSPVLSTGTGSASYNAGTRTVTWNLGTLAGNGTAFLTVSSTVSSAAGLVVTGSVSTSTPNDPVGNNAAINYNEVLQSDAPLSVIAVGSFNDAFLSTSVFENGFERELGTIYRPFYSPDGNWIIFRTDLAGLPSAENGGVIIGHNVAGTWSFDIVAREGTTAPVASLPNAK
ncbi:MAG: lamin tail domain-containing protein, partial [Phycisphaerales bacterium]|nr:lamin tail domain-containing protein [Phycisphaerales bacterium]